MVGGPKRPEKVFPADRLHRQDITGLRQMHLDVLNLTSHFHDLSMPRTPLLPLDVHQGQTRGTGPAGQLDALNNRAVSGRRLIQPKGFMDQQITSLGEQGGFIGCGAVAAVEDRPFPISDTDGKIGLSVASRSRLPEMPRH